MGSSATTTSRANRQGGLERAMQSGGERRRVQRMHSDEHRCWLRSQPLRGGDCAAGGGSVLKEPAVVLHSPIARRSFAFSARCVANFSSRGERVCGKHYGRAEERYGKA